MCGSSLRNRKMPVAMSESAVFSMLLSLRCGGGTGRQSASMGTSKPNFAEN
jgi:hypothetical protein